MSDRAQLATELWNGTWGKSTAQVVKQGAPEICQVSFPTTTTTVTTTATTTSTTTKDD
jgi:hypothetical protein